ncbi:arginase family protein [Kitasatospora sp. MAP5-34]|uniref:arginase family protein n=1 Tax=Kitasatospora sp. MAP5-34 TaxID=3035102 RepID=UPI00247598D2|nr:arginase family protein [Kitasatospora sp. MAP5-34]MDH6577394.1 arginase [Kitasatospora sp. MAP5-34]
MQIEVIGVPFDGAGLTSGCAGATAALRQAGLVERLGERHEVADGGDISVVMAQGSTERDPRSGLVAQDALVRMVGDVRQATRRILTAGRFPVVTGGDCTMLLGMLAAVRDVHGSAGLVLADGHEDAWPPLESLTGEGADCEISIALGLVAAEDLPPELAGIVPLLEPTATAILGARDLEELSENGVASLRGRVWFASDAELTGQIAVRAAEAAAAVGAASPAWWLHIDLDVLATDQIDGIDCPQPGGLTWAELTELSAVAAGSPGCVGISVADYNPDLDPGHKDAAHIVDYLAEVLAAC